MIAMYALSSTRAGRVRAAQSKLVIHPAVCGVLHCRTPPSLTRWVRKFRAGFHDTVCA